MTDVKVKVNADGVGWSVPNPIANQGPLTLAAYRGQVVEMPAEEAERLRGIRVRVYYTDPVTGVPNGAYREEPSVVDANEAEAANAEAVAAKQRKITELENQLAQARNDLPLVSSPPAPTPGPVALTPTQGVPRLIDDARNLDEPAKAQGPSKSTAAASSSRR